jgi:hypothetical protein
MERRPALTGRGQDQACRLARHLSLQSFGGQGRANRLQGRGSGLVQLAVDVAPVRGVVIGTSTTQVLEVAVDVTRLADSPPD